jgi:hypothetical protein
MGSCPSSFGGRALGHPCATFGVVFGFGLRGLCRWRRGGRGEEPRSTLLYR